MTTGDDMISALFKGIDDFEIEDDYEPDEDDKAEFSEFFCRQCGAELDEDNAPCGEDEDAHKCLCYDCLANAVDEPDDGSFCAGCGCLLTDDNAPVTGNLCHDCK